MRIKKIEIINYKSLRESKNVLYVDDSITTIIGVNECGKSNIIESIKGIDLFDGCPKEYDNFKNIDCVPDDRICIKFYLMEGMEQTILTCYPNYYTEIEGSLKEELESNEKIGLFISELEDTIKKFSTYKNNGEKQKILLKGKYLLLPNITTQIKGAYNAFKDNSFTQEAQVVIDEFKKIYNKVPKIIDIPIKFEDLKGEYTYDEIIASKSNDFARRLIELANISIEDISELKNSARGKEETLKEKFKDMLNEKVSKPFLNYYAHPDFDLKFNFSNNSLKIFGKTDDKYVAIDERSQGLRWYFMMFVYMQSLSLKYEDRCIYLFDEPGIYLHVNAQKELLAFFDSLANNNSQVIYSTHSPFMINKNRLQSLRPIIKNKEGITEIYNNIFSDKIAITNKSNTLAPVFASIGYDLSNSCFSDGDLNVLVEGITDKLILDAVNEIYYNKKVNFIPCGGVNNIHNVLSLVIGFGYDFIVLMDNDGAGRKEETKLINSFGFYVDDKIKYINGKGANKTIEYCIEDNICQKDKEKMTVKSVTSDNSKKMFALEFYSKVSKKNLDLSEDTKNNFDKIFNSIEIK